MKVITIGRLKGNDVIIDNDDRVSRHHLQIVQLDDGSYHLIDFNSTNGTFVNGNRVQGEVVLDEGDFVRIGDTMLPWTTYFEPEFVSQAQEGVEEAVTPTGDHKASNSVTETQPSRANAFAILGFIFAFVISPLGLIFSIIGLAKAKKMGGKQKGLAVAGLIISIISILITIIYITLIAGAIGVIGGAFDSY
jgi:hypothetical protein